MSKLIFFASYHKTGSLLALKLSSKYCRNKSIPFIKLCDYDGIRVDHQTTYQLRKIIEIYIKSNTPVVFFENQAQRLKLKISLDGCHMGVIFIRHPYEIIMSGVRYHQKTKEKWCNTPNLQATYFKHKTGKTYQHYLKSLPFDQKILFEMRNKAFKTIKDMYNNMDIPGVLYIKLEDFLKNPEIECNKIAEHLKLDKDTLINIVKTDCNKNSAKDHVTNLSSDYTWPSNFKQVHYDTFLNLFPKDTLSRCGYSVI